MHLKSSFNVLLTAGVTLAAPIQADASPLPLTLVHDFPAATWTENIAVRSNGMILATELRPQPRVYQIDPTCPEKAVVVAEIDNIAAILGITEGEPDVFYIATGNEQAPPTDSYIYRLDFNQHVPIQAERVASLPTAILLNGLAYFAPHSILAADSGQGVIWHLNIHTGEAEVAVNSTYTQAPFGQIGVNGVRISESTLYFTNTYQQLLVKVAIDHRGHISGDFDVVVEGGFVPDDFTLDSQGNAYISSFATGSNGIILVSSNSDDPVFIAGIRGPTSAAFGRTSADSEVLYVSTTGGDNAYSHPPIKVSGKIFKVEVQAT